LIERFHQELNKAHETENNINYNQIDNLDEQKMLNLFLNDFKTKYDSIISHLFYGVLETKAQCQQCKYIKYNFQIYSFIEFPLERVNLLEKINN
jgi:ubiquitin C-terminal hydrolase